MSEFILYTRLPSPYVAEGSMPVPIVQGSQCAVVNADSAEEAVSIAFDHGLFLGSDGVFVLQLGDEKEYTITHSHEAAPAE